jgi:hypothetical protein
MVASVPRANLDSAAIRLTKLATERVTERVTEER